MKDKASDKRNIDQIVRVLNWEASSKDYGPLLTREWLITNGLAGYASGTLSGVATRRFHGLLISNLPGQLARSMMLNRLGEEIFFSDGTHILLVSDERVGGRLEMSASRYLLHFRLQAGVPTWQFRLRDSILEKCIHMPNLQNTVHVNYRIISGSERLKLHLRPAVHFRHHEGALGAFNTQKYRFAAIDRGYQIADDSSFPPLRFMIYGKNQSAKVAPEIIPDLLYRIEESRGYDSTGELWSPGIIEVELSAQDPVTFVASTEEWDVITALTPDYAAAADYERKRRLLNLAPMDLRSEVPAELVLGADQFVFRPIGRAQDSARAKASGDEMRSVIAGYHWFTDWGRDTMISLEGLSLLPGRHHEAGFVLRTFAHYIKGGLIPNMFPEGADAGRYNTADATLWFFHAISRYLDYTGDRATLRVLIPKLLEIVDQHIKGTHFNIGVDPKDGLLRQGAEGYPLTWMDAKVDSWVVTPRRGKAVEINALWYNALRLLEQWVSEERDEKDAARLKGYADRVYENFTKRFWNEKAGYLFDVVDGENGNDARLRPNQLFAISLKYPVVEKQYWRPIVHMVRDRLLTPVGLRTLDRDHPDYKPRYDGDLRARDAAYHQGTVWAWLVGPLVDAWLALYPNDKATARSFLHGFIDHLNEACVGSISEIFDAEPPYTPRGCIAQAWSIAEVLRAWVKTAE